MSWNIQHSVDLVWFQCVMTSASTLRWTPSSSTLILAPYQIRRHHYYLLNYVWWFFPCRTLDPDRPFITTNYCWVINIHVLCFCPHRCFMRLFTEKISFHSWLFSLFYIRFIISLCVHLWQKYYQKYFL